ncbi:hypothetical protein MTO96_037514 [Rhipicephalus appendiculatus]
MERRRRKRTTVRSAVTRILNDMTTIIKTEPTPTGSSSLSDILWTGSNLNSIVFDLLLKFRSFDIVISSYIEKASLQVSLAEEDRDAFRYFWFEEGLKKNCA